MTDKAYVIADRQFTQQELVLGQIQWIKKRLKDYNVTSLAKEEIIELVIDEGPALLAITLIPVGQTRAEKVRGGWAGVLELQTFIQENATPAEVMEIASDFFRLNRAALNKLMGSAAVDPMMADISGTG